MTRATRKTLLTAVCVLTAAASLAAAAPGVAASGRGAAGAGRGRLVESPSYWLARAEAEAEAAGWPAVERFSTYGSVAVRYARAGDGDGFRRAVRRMKAVEKDAAEPSARATTYALLAEGYARVGDEAGLAECMRLANAAAEEYRATLPEERKAYADPTHYVLDGLLSARRFDDAMKLARARDKASRRADALGKVAAARAKAGDAAGYGETIWLAEAEAERAERDEPEPGDAGYHLMVLSWAQTAAGDFARAGATADRLRPDSGAAVHARLALDQITKGDRGGYGRSADRAAAVAAKCDSDVAAQSAYGVLAKALARAADAKRLRRFVAQSPRAKGLLDADYAYETAVIRAEAGDVAGAAEALRRGDALASGDDQFAQAMRFRGLKHRNVLAALAKAGEYDAALKMGSGELPQVTGGIAAGWLDWLPPHWPVVVVAECQAEAGKLPEALATLGGVKDRQAREDSATAIAKAAGRSGKDLEKLREWIEGFETPRSRAAAFFATAEGLIERDEGNTGAAPADPSGR